VKALGLENVGGSLRWKGFVKQAGCNNFSARSENWGCCSRWVVNRAKRWCGMRVTRMRQTANSSDDYKKPALTKVQRPTQATFFVTRDFNLWPLTFWPQNKRVSRTHGIIVEHFRVKFGDRSCIGFWDIVRKNRQTNEGRKNPALATSLGVSNQRSVIYSEEDVDGRERLTTDEKRVLRGVEQRWGYADMMAEW